MIDISRIKQKQPIRVQSKKEKNERINRLKNNFKNNPSDLDGYFEAIGLQIQFSMKILKLYLLRTDSETESERISDEGSEKDEHLLSKVLVQPSLIDQHSLIACQLALENTLNSIPAIDPSINTDSVTAR